MSKWRRYRFYTRSEDYRPVKWPPPGPYWCSGYSEDDQGEAAVLIAYITKGVKLRDYWPEAESAEFTEASGIIFTDRFPCPEWWRDITEAAKPAPDAGREE